MTLPIEELYEALDALEEVFDKKDNEQGLGMVESYREQLDANGELSDRQVGWIERNMKMHKLVDEDDRKRNGNITDINDILRDADEQSVAQAMADHRNQAVRISRNKNGRALNIPVTNNTVIREEDYGELTLEERVSRLEGVVHTLTNGNDELADIFVGIQKAIRRKLRR